jgi:hypothetical protein
MNKATSHLIVRKEAKKKRKIATNVDKINSSKQICVLALVHLRPKYQNYHFPYNGEDSKHQEIK